MCKLLPLLLLLVGIERLVASAVSTDYLVDPLQTLKRHMNTSADPCSDFYEHACGGWRAQHRDVNYSSQVELLDIVYNAQLAQLLEGVAVGGQPRFVQLLRDYHATCRSIGGSQERSYDPGQFIRWLRQHEAIKWPWPEPDAADSEDGAGDWPQLLGILMRYGLNGVLLHGSVAQLDSNVDVWLLEVQAPWPAEEPEAEAEAGFRPLSRSQFQQHYRTAQPLGHQQRQFWLQLKRFEAQLLQLSQQAADAAEAEEEEQLAPVISLQALPHSWLRKLLLAALPTTDEIRPKIRVYDLSYFERLRQLLATQEPLFLCRYLLLRLLQHLELAMPPRFDRITCVAQARQLLTHAAAWLHDQQHQLCAEAEPQLRQLFAALRRQFNSTLSANRNGFDAATRRYLDDKIRHMRLQLGVLPRPHTAQQLEGYYKRLNLSSTDFYGNQLAALRHATQAQWTRLLQSPRQAEEDEGEGEQQLYVLEPDSYGSYASPFFMPRSNAIVLPLSLLGAPVYRRQQHALFAHSSLGFLLAHELSHGFGPSDVLYDQHGNRAAAAQQRRLEASERFGRQLRCLQRRHAQVADEKFADTNGLAVAFAAYFGAGQEPLERGDGWAASRTQEQLFFLNAAQFFCHAAEAQLEVGPHGSSRQRVNDAVASFAEFRRVFDCAATSASASTSAAGQQQRQHQRQRQRQRQRSCRLY